MATIKGTRKIRSIEERKADMNTQNAGGEITQPKVDIAFTKERKTNPVPVKPLDPIRVSNAMKGLSAPAGSPIEAQSLKEAAEIVNKQREENLNKANKVPTVGEFESDITEKVEPPQPLSTTERKTEVDREFAERMKMLEAEPARLTKGQDLADLEKERIKAIEEIEIEEKLMTEGIENEVQQERIAGARKIQEKEGVGLGLALKRYDTRQNAKAKLDPNDTIIFDAIVEQFNSEDFDSNEAFNAAISEYHKDGVDADDLEKANDAVAAVFGQNFADFTEDEYMINERGLDRAIVEGNRELVNARKIGETIKSGKAGARVTNAYLETIMNIDPSLVSDAIGQIISSPDASDDAKRQASAFSADFFTDVETGIGQEQDYLTEAKFRAGLGTPQERQQFIEGTQILEKLENADNGDVSGALKAYGTTKESFARDDEMRNVILEAVARERTIKKENSGLINAFSSIGEAGRLQKALKSGGEISNQLANLFNVSPNVMESEFATGIELLENAGLGNQKFYKDYNTDPRDFTDLSNKTRNLDRAKELFEKLKDDEQFNAITKATTTFGAFWENLGGADVSELGNDIIELRTIINNELIEFMKETSGVAISEPEVKRLQTVFANTSNSPTEFKKNLERYLKNFETARAGALNSRGIESPEALDKIISGQTVTLPELLREIQREGEFGFDTELSIDPETGQVSSPTMFKELSPVEAAKLSDEDFAKWEALQAEPEAQVGSLSKRFESGGDSKALGVDSTGGASYGKYQMTENSGNAKRFAQEMGIQGEPGTDEFKRNWDVKVEENPEFFAQKEQEYIGRTHFEPLSNKINESLGLNVQEMPRAFQEVVWSTAVQHGGSTDVIDVAYNNLEQSMGSFTLEDLISEIYKERATRFTSSTPEVQEAVKNRFIMEERDALQLNNELA